MKKLLFILPACILLSSACSKSESEPDIDSVICTKSLVTIQIGGTQQLEFLTVFPDGQKEKYDLDSNPMQLVFTSDDEYVAYVDEHGVLHAAGSGTTSVRAHSLLKSQIAISVKVKVESPALYDLSKNFDPKMKVGTFHQGGYDSQCFDIDSKGNIYYALSKSLGQRGYLGLLRMSPNGQVSQEMILYYSYHGTSFSIEEVGDDVYIWTSTFGTKSSDGTYGTSQMFCRIKFEPGKEYTPEDIASNCFWSPKFDNVNVSRDRLTGRIAVQSADKVSEGGKNYTHRVDIYNVEDLFSAPMKSVTTKTMKRGGDWKGPIKTEVNETSTVTVHDLTSVKPSATFRYLNTTVYGYGTDSSGSSGVKSFQGFCFYDGHIYIANDRNRYTRDATLSKLSLDGTLILKPTHMKFVDDIDAIRQCGLVGTDTYLEIEGIQIINNSLHFGCLSWDATGCFNSVINAYPR